MLAGKIVGILVLALIVFIVAKKLIKVSKKFSAILAIFTLAVSMGFVTYQDVIRPPLLALEMVQDQVNKDGLTRNVKIEKGDVLIRSKQTGDKWVNLSESEIVKSEVVGAVTKNITIRYNGKEYKVADSGIVNVIKTLEGLKK